MATWIGAFFLFLALVATAASVVCLVVGRALKGSASETISWAGRVAAVLSFVTLTVCCGVLLYCFLIGDYSVQYVLDEHSSSGNLLFTIAGLWAGREGSLLFWAWLISLFNAIVAIRRMSEVDPLDNMAVLVGQVVLLAFVIVLFASDSNNPFIATESTYYDSDGSLTTAAMTMSMNVLLEHWAMAVHPPALFLGYAGLTVPFAYAIAALIVNDPTKKWIVRSERFVLAAWLFLTIGIGLGSIWAYVCLGWGGYWGWDPVENASLLPWLVCVALVHSLSQYKRRGAFKRWTVMCATLAFAFCIVGTFISRSGLVQSVHAFSGDSVSLIMFAILIGASVVAGAIGCIVRRRTFGAVEGDEIQSLLSKEGAYFLNNVVMLVMAVVLAYLTIAQALPAWMPFGGTSISSGMYDSIARPIGILFLLLMAVCPLLGWSKTDPAAFKKKALVPAICAVVVFTLLVVYFVVALLPAYNAVIDAGGSSASELLSAGPSWYYNGLAVFGFLVASLLLMNSLFQIARAVRVKGGSAVAKLPAVGSGIGHLAMAVILVGLIGSNMYVTESTGYLERDAETDTCSQSFAVGDYELYYTGNTVAPNEDQTQVDYSVSFDVYKNGAKIGSIDSSVTLVTLTQQRKYNAGVLSLPNEDVFVVYQGVRESDGALRLDTRINPFVSVTWAGFGLLCLGMALALFGRRSGGVASRKDSDGGREELGADAVETAPTEMAPAIAGETEAGE